jgi:SAM-dependent methyltransferase
MVWCLAKLYYGAHKPVILFGEFWDDLIESFRRDMNIDERELAVLYQALKPEDVLNIIIRHEDVIRHSNILNHKKAMTDEQGFILGGSSELVQKTFRAYNQIASDYYSSHAGKLVAQEQLDEFKTLVNAPAQVLDIGSGPGNDAGYLADKYSVTGVEMSRRFYEIAAFENPEVNFINADVITYDIGKEKYKGIWARDAIHHIPEKDMDNVFKKIADALVPGGILYLLVREGHGEIIESEKTEYSTIEKFFHLFTEEELVDRAKKAGLTKVKIEHTHRSHKWLVGVFKK